MYMSEKEIVSSFKNADNKTSQLTILSELNATDKDTIRRILRENGVPESEIPQKKPRVKKATGPVGSGGKNKVPKKEYDEKPDKEVKRITSEQAEEATAEVPERKVIPKVIAKVCKERIAILTDYIIQLEAERDAICDYLTGAEVSE